VSAAHALTAGREFDPAAGHPFPLGSGSFRYGLLAGESALFQGKDHCADLALDVLIIVLIAILAYRFRGRISRR
jgi:hypothetical protein